MLDLQSKAIVLRSFFFKDKQKMVTLFSEHFGLISMVLKGISSKKPTLLSLSETFSESEFILSKGRSDLFLFQDGTLLDLHLPLRNKLSYLRTASQMGNALLKSQLPEKASPLLYALFSSFLKQIPSFSSQETLLGCFYLKLLRHEGSYCLQETRLSLEDQDTLEKMTNLSSFMSLKEINIPSNLFKTIEKTFSDATSF